MNDKQTTALVILLILAFLFWLYNTGKLGNVVSVITGKSTQAASTTQTASAATEIPSVFEATLAPTTQYTYSDNSGSGDDTSSNIWSEVGQVASLYA
jgi:hypothetical protein